jgi:uncharacterized glyoxalase superfamily protein PhnB
MISVAGRRGGDDAPPRLANSWTPIPSRDAVEPVRVEGGDVEQDSREAKEPARAEPRDGYHTLTPRIVVDDVEAQVGFLRDVFGATGEVPIGRPAEIAIGDSLIMVTPAAERALFAAFLYVYVDDADAVYRRALTAGAESLEGPLDTPYGDRRAMVRDPFGNIFQIAHQLR